MDLDNSHAFKSLDPMGVEKALELFPEQVSECWKQGFGSDIPELKPTSVIVSGMGGSSNAAKILQSLFESELKIPFEVYNDYGLPSWVGKDTLVVVNSYSGNTEESLSAIEAAANVEAQVLGVATGGKIGEMIATKTIHGALINPGLTNPTNFPKSGLGVSFGGLAGALAKSGIIPLKDTDINASLVELKEIKENWNAKELAKWLNGYMPVFFGGRPLIGALNAGRNAMCEISRNFTQFYDFPEVNHVLIEAMQKPSAAKEKIKYLFFVSKFNSPRVQTRYEITSQILKEQGLDFSTYELKGQTKLTQALELPYLSAWIAFYLSILQSTDPGPEPWIIKLKEALSQPVH